MQCMQNYILAGFILFFRDQGQNTDSLLCHVFVVHDFSRTILELVQHYTMLHFPLTDALSYRFQIAGYSLFGPIQSKSQPVSIRHSKPLFDTELSESSAHLRSSPVNLTLRSGSLDLSDTFDCNNVST